MIAPEISQPINPGFGEMYGPGPHYVTPPNGIAVWMWRKGQHVRFYDEHGNQVGPEHRNVVPAIIWAAAHQWIDPGNVNLSIGCILEVRRQMELRGSKSPDYVKAVEEGAWNPEHFPALPEADPSLAGPLATVTLPEIRERSGLVAEVSKDLAPGVLR